MTAIAEFADLGAQISVGNSSRKALTHDDDGTFNPAFADGGGESFGWDSLLPLLDSDTKPSWGIGGEAP